MRTIHLVKDGEFDQLAELKGLLGNASVQPYTLDEVRLACRVLDKLTSEEVTLEDEEWKFVCNRLKNTRWVRATREIVSFVDGILGAD